MQRTVFFFFFVIKEMPTKPEVEINFFLRGFVCRLICHLFMCLGAFLC